MRETKNKLPVYYTRFESVVNDINFQKQTFEFVKLLENMGLFALFQNLFNVVGAHGFEP